MANADREIEAILEDFDKRCPECFDEGHGGDGCSYCWNHDPSQDAKNKAKAAIKVLIKNREAALLDRIKAEADRLMSPKTVTNDARFEAGWIDCNRDWLKARDNIVKEIRGEEHE